MCFFVENFFFAYLNGLILINPSFPCILSYPKDQGLFVPTGLQQYQMMFEKHCLYNESITSSYIFN